MTEENNSPRRITWRRGRSAKGWRKPDNTVAVTRGTPWGNPFPVTKNRDALMAVAEFSRMVMGDPDYQARCRQQLQGKNLMCFCKPDDPCHADVLLQVANSLSKGTPEQISGSTSNQLAVVAPNGGYNSSEAKTDHKRQEVSHDLYDTDSADDFLHLLGFGFCDPVILSAGGKDFRRIPRKPKNGYDWRQVTAQACNGRDWAGFIRLLKDRPNACFQSCVGGTTNDEITGGWLLVYEIDHYPKEKQYGLWEKAGLPEPTLVMDTGNDSLHVWYRLDTHYECDDISDGREHLANAINDVLPDGVTCDEKVCRPHQPMRLAGFPHPKSGKLSRVIAASGNIYPLDQLMDCCPPLPPKPETGCGAGELWKPLPDGEEILPEGLYPSPSDLNGYSVPLHLGLSHKTQDLIKSGQKPGEKRHRWEVAHRISRSLQAAKVAIESLGYPVAGLPIDSFQEFCRNSRCERGYLGKFETVPACAAHFENNVAKFGPAELTTNAFLNALAKWAEDQGRWRSKALRRQAGSNRSTGSPRHVVDRSLPARLDFFKRYIVRAVRENRNSLRREVYLKEVQRRLDLKNHISPKRFTEMVMEVQEDLMGNTYRVMTANDRLKMDRPEIEWLVEGAVPKGDLTMIGGRAKVGKTVTGVDVVTSILTNEPWLGRHESSTDAPVILITDDQADGDTATMLERQGIWDHPRLLWSSKFRFTENQFDQLLSTVRDNPGAVVVLDSLRSVTRSLDCSESDASLGLVLYDLKAQVMAAGGSMLLIHHANKTADAVGMECLSGHNSIAGAANTIITVHFLPKPDGQGLQKGIPERRIFCEGRSGPGFDVVATRSEKGSFRYVADYETFLNQQAEQAGNDKVSVSLMKAAVLVQKGLVELLEIDKAGESAVSTLELLKRIGGCSPAVQIKADLDSEAKFKSLERGLNKFLKMGLLETQTLKGGFTTYSSLQLWMLSDMGKQKVRMVLT